MARNVVESINTPERLFHWIPGELVVIVQLPRHPFDETLLDTLAEQVRSQLNALLVQQYLTLELYGTHGRWLEDLAMPPVRRRAFIFGFLRQQPLAAIFFHARHKDPAVVDATPMVLSFLQKQLEQLAQVGLRILSAMPNWLVTAAPVLYGSGGPALPPRPAPTLEVTASANAFAGWHFLLPDHESLLDPNGGQDVTVAVLDTAHHPDLVYSAANRPELSRNWLLHNLAANLKDGNGSFEIEYNRYPVTNDVRTGRGFRDETRYYPMLDHGLFVSGIIRDIAPRARLRLIRILNDYGGGDIYNLFAALTDLEHELMAGTLRRLVLNLSLTIMPDIRRVPYIWFYDRQWPTPELAGAMRILAHIEEGLRLLFESLTAHGVLIVAAAGNDSFRASTKGNELRPPRAPARYTSTLSVTSVNSRQAPSAFANAACMPPYDAGVATFGGDAYGALDAHGWPDAVRGVYISSTFPKGEQNTTGWADWSGTSFSTAVISALGTHLLARAWTASQAIVRISSGQEHGGTSLFGTTPEAPTLLANIVHAQQRFRG